MSPARADDWRSKYSTGRPGPDFEACCGINDGLISEQLGYPKMRRDTDGSYDVKIGQYWVRYDFPVVHRSEGAYFLQNEPALYLRARRAELALPHGEYQSPILCRGLRVEDVAIGQGIAVFRAPMHLGLVFNGAGLE